MILKKKKFWTAIKLKKKESKFGILLDKNLLKTPQKKDCLISNIRIAKDLLKEWSSIQDDINFHNMPVTQICFASLDRKRKEKIILLNKLTEYGMTDLLFYRDTSGTELEKLQSKKWDKLLCNHFPSVLIHLWILFNRFLCILESFMIILVALIASVFTGHGSLISFHFNNLSEFVTAYPTLNPAIPRNLVKLLITIRFLYIVVKSIID